MPFNRKTALRQWSQAKAAVSNPNLPQHIKDLYQKSADHNQVALGLDTAQRKKAQQDMLNQPLEDQGNPAQSQNPQQGQPPQLLQ